MSKVILTGEQVKALDTAIEEFGFTKVLDLHQSGKWCGRFESLNNLNDGDLRRIFDYGYQTKEDYIQGLEKNADKCERDTDNVNKPSHYTTGQIEVIDYIKDKLTPEQYVGYCMGNVIKYTSRWEHKGGVQDLEKAEVYLKWAIKAAKGNE